MKTYLIVYRCPALYGDTVKQFGVEAINSGVALDILKYKLNASRSDMDVLSIWEKIA